jgi:hypothetical protein
MSNIHSNMHALAATTGFAKVDHRKAVAEATGGSGGAFLRIKKDGHEHVIRFIPSFSRADGTESPFILAASWHYVPNAQGKTTVVPCYGMQGRPCPLCEFDKECQELIGQEDGRSKKKQYTLPSAKYGVSASQRFLVNCMKRETDPDHGGFVWTGPHILEMPVMLMQKVFGLQWKPDSVKNALAEKVPTLMDLGEEGVAVRVQATVAPEFFVVSIDSDRSGAYRIGPLYKDEAEQDAALAKIVSEAIHLDRVIKWPEPAVYDTALSILRRELEEMTGAVGEVLGEVADARSVMRDRVASRAALPAARTVLEDDDDGPVSPPVTRSARAATQQFDMDDDI